MPITISRDVIQACALYCEPSREAVLSWNTTAPEGELRVRILRAHQPDSAWLPHARWSRTGRHSFSAKQGDVVVETDVITALQPFDGIELSTLGEGMEHRVKFDLLALATPVHNIPSSPYRGGEMRLEVSTRSQHVVDHERGWCSPATLSMLHAYYGHDFDVATTARAVFDSAYNGTGNWSFNVAFSGSLGLCGVVAYLRNLDHAEKFIARNIPLGLSYSWRGDELPGAPLEQSEGHLVVLRGFTAGGDCIVNDPASPELTVTYPREAIDRIWTRNKGAAYVVAPRGADLESLINT